MSCVRGCCATQADHYRGVTFGAASDGVFEQRRRERTLDKDMSSYKALRQQGLQPKNVNGSAALARDASSRFEVESGQILPDQRSVKLAESVLGDMT
jgi:hypothetical protein